MLTDDLIVNGVKIGAQSMSKETELTTITLPSGKSAAIRKGSGRDLMRAQRAVGSHSDPAAVIFALIAELTVIDGKKLVYEDVLALELADVLTLQVEVAGANFQSPRPAPSPPSSTSDFE